MLLACGLDIPQLQSKREIVLALFLQEENSLPELL